MENKRMVFVGKIRSEREGYLDSGSENLEEGEWKASGLWGGGQVTLG